MPLSAYELERNSVSRWLSETFPEAPLRQGPAPKGFQPPSFLLEQSRSTNTPVLAAAVERRTTINAVYFGHLDLVDGAPKWSPLAVAGRLEAALQDCEHLIPLRDEAGAETGKLRLEVEVTGRSGSDTDLTISIRYRCLVWDRQRDLEGETLTDINLRMNQ